jgi:CBS domain containing-hemolysin-like protein
LLEEAKHRGSLTVEEAWLFEGAFRLREKTAADVMTPRADLVVAPVEANSTHLIELVNLSGRARIPVYEHTIDRIVGVVDARDLLPFALEGAEPRGAREIMRPPLFVPPTRPVEALLRDLQRARVQFVIVGAEGQEALGVVTVEDILEEIIGDIRGEFEEEEPAVRLLEDGSAVVRGDVRVSDVNRILGTTLPSADGETVEALVRGLWREPPSEGDETTAPSGDVLGIETLVGPRIWSVRIRPGRPQVAA